MTSPPDDRTTVLQGLIDRIKAGDRAAVGELVAKAQARFRALAGTILNVDFHDIKERGKCDTQELRQELSLRLLNKLGTDPVEDVPHLINRAAQHIRWYLLDLTKVMDRETPAAFGPDDEPSDRGVGRDRHAGRGNPPPQPPQPSDDDPSVGDPSRTALQCASNPWHAQRRLLECVAKLPVELYQVVDLRITFGLSSQEVAKELHVAERTVGRRWHAAVLTLQNCMLRSFPDQPSSSEPSS
ncbi:MAG: sigma-70 family RNA polymerase sigma factor [Planctomycetia bacterium]|nr:sigma-70 family RNA polymerase sigma factor [Planctomycetia bacterium]